ncbi:MAG: 6,7-dimethyl-8-ribityllumazine synthase [Euryarchaeota archaeon]|nr:6,7-dimethyl-8-ribityllumazine synthase [Euryarchaeota archaeon]
MREKMKIGIICTSFHKEEMEKMLHYATEESISNGFEIAVLKWVPGVMEIPLTIDRMITENNLEGIVTLGIIEEGETQHGLVMGHVVINSIINLQLEYNIPIGLGIIGPGAKKEHIAPRLESHSRAAVNAIYRMIN